MRTVLLALFAVLTFAAGTALANGGPEPSFDVAAIRDSAGGTDKKEFSCASPPAPLRDLNVESMYAKGDQSHSTIDPEADAAYKKATQPVSDFEKGLVSMANRYVRSNPPRPDIAACALDWMAAWAEGGAMLGAITRNGEYTRKWTLGSISNTWLQIRGEASLDPGKTKTVLNWIHTLGEKAKEDFSRDAENNSRLNNHLYWAAWGVGSAGIATGDKDMFDWAMDKARVGLDQVGRDGSLPLEIEREKKAFHYHIFAAAPLFLLAEAGSHNGVDLFSYNDSALKRLGALCLKNLGTGGADFEKRTGKTQDLNRTGTSSDLGWVEIYAKHYPNDPLVQDTMDKFRPFKQSRVGGDITLLYAGKAMKEKKED